MSDCRFDVSPVNYPDPDPDCVFVTGRNSVQHGRIPMRSLNEYCTVSTCAERKQFISFNKTFWKTTQYKSFSYTNIMQFIISISRFSKIELL